MPANRMPIPLFVVLFACMLIFAACSSDDASTPISDGDAIDGDSIDGDTDSIDGDASDTDGDAIDGDTDGDAEWQPVEPKVEQRDGYTLVWLSGTPYEMGHQQGELLYDTIADAIEFVNNDIMLKAIVDMAETWGIIDMALNNSYQDVLDECQGLVDGAEGTGLTMNHCLVLNFGDVMLENVPIMKRRSQDGPGCSELIASGAATPDGRLYHARNLDWGSMDISIIHKHPVIFVRQPSDGIPHAYVGFPLNVSPYTGMNAAGISICSNEADPADTVENPETGRSHVQMLGRILKTAESLDDVRSFIMGETHMSSEILVAADGNSKQGSVFEMSPDLQAERPLDENGIVYVTNHFEHPDMVDLDAPQNPEKVREDALAIEAGTLERDDAVHDSSLMRLWRFEQLVEPDAEDTHYGQLDIQGLATVMRDRTDPVTGVTYPFTDEHIDNDAGLATNGPMHFVIFDPEKLLFWVMAGMDEEGGKPYVAQQDYICFSLGELLGYPNAAECTPPVIANPATAAK